MDRSGQLDQCSQVRAELAVIVSFVLETGRSRIQVGNACFVPIAVTRGRSALVNIGCRVVVSNKEVTDAL